MIQTPYFTSFFNNQYVKNQDNLYSEIGHHLHFLKYIKNSIIDSSIIKLILSVQLLVHSHLFKYGLN